MRILCVFCGRASEGLGTREVQTDWGIFLACDDEFDCEEHINNMEALA